MLPLLSLVLTVSHCLENAPILNSTSGNGFVQNLGGLQTYVTGSHNSKHAILLISDVFGYEAPNLRKIADKVAAAGFLAVVPDFFYGEPWNTNKTDWDGWIKSHSTDKGYKDARRVITALKHKGVSAVGVGGFCWGGKVAVQLADFDAIKAAVLLHPSWLTVDDISQVKIPIAVFGAELDNGLPLKQLKQFKQILSKQAKVKNLVKIFPSVDHGWTLRWNATDESAVKSAEEAHTDMTKWFSKYVM